MLWKTPRYRRNYYEFSEAKKDAQTLADRDGIKWCVLGHEEALEGMTYQLYSEHELLFSDDAHFVARPIPELLEGVDF